MRREKAQKATPAPKMILFRFGLGWGDVSTVVDLFCTSEVGDGRDFDLGVGSSRIRWGSSAGCVGAGAFEEFEEKIEENHDMVGYSIVAEGR